MKFHYGKLPKERIELLPRIMINHVKNVQIVIHFGWFMFYFSIEKLTKN